MGFQLLSSLVITLIICFSLPAIGLGAALGALSIGVWSPLSVVSELARGHLVDFLMTFGAGNLSQGVLTICLTLSIVGGLFEVFAFYKVHMCHMRS